MPYHLLFDDPRRPAFLLGLASLGTLLGAFTFQAFGFEPCQLCLWQRFPYAFVMVLGLAAIPLRRSRLALTLILLVMGVALLGNSGLALYHSGVEQHWWANAFDCGAPSGPSGSVADLKQTLMATNYVPCDRIPWSLFGITIANLNIVAAFVLGVFALVSARVLQLFGR